MAASIKKRFSFKGNKISDAGSTTRESAVTLQPRHFQEDIYQEMPPDKEVEEKALQACFMYLSENLSPDDVAMKMNSRELLTKTEHDKHLSMKQAHISDTIKSEYLLQCLRKREAGFLTRLCEILREIEQASYLADVIIKAYKAASQQDETLSDTEASELMDKYDHLFKNPNVVSLDYRIIAHQKEGKGTSCGRKMLCIGVIKEDTNSELPKIAVYETSKKSIEVPVHIFVQGEIEALAPYVGGSEIKNEILKYGGTVGVNTIFKGEYRLLTCAHILTEFDDTNIRNQRRVQVKHNPEDVAFQSIPVIVEDHVPVTVYNTPSQENPMRANQDLAWATLTADHGLPSVKQIGCVSGIRKPKLNDKITLFGAASQEPLKNIPILSNIARPRMKFQTSNDGDKYVFFHNFWTLDITQGVVMRGDSGSAVIAEVDKAVIGILVCSDKLHIYAYFCALEI